MKITVMLSAAAGNVASRLSALLSAAKPLGATTLQAVIFGKVDEAELSCLDCDEIYLLPSEKPYCAEAILPQLVAFSKEQQPGLILFAPDISGAELAPRLSMRLGIPCQTGVSALSIEDDCLQLKHGAYNRNLHAKLSLPLPAVLALAKGAFEPIPLLSSPKASLTVLPCEDEEQAWHGEASVKPFELVEDLTTASLIVAGGRGVGGKANMAELGKLAGQMGGMLGLTRPAAVDGWSDHSQHIGISGVMVKPDLCLALGASGASAFMNGIAGSKTLVAVNTDKSASIFRNCDAGIVGDCMEFTAALQQLLEEERS